MRLPAHVEIDGWHPVPKKVWKRSKPLDPEMAVQLPLEGVEARTDTFDLKRMQRRRDLKKSGSSLLYKTVRRVAADKYHSAQRFALALLTRSS